MSLTREQQQNIHKIERRQRINRLLTRLLSLLPQSAHKSRAKEVMIPTEFGEVRTLWYGFDQPEKQALLFDLHGGGFVFGSADLDEAMCLQFQHEAGCKVISIDYAKAPKFPYPTAVNQVYAVAKQVWQNTERFGVDADRMAIGGHSAGANLSAVACIKARQEGLFQFSAQILDYPPLDLATAPEQKPQPKGAIPASMARMFNDCYLTPAQATEIYASPVYATASQLQGLPPALFILAGGDSLHDEGLRYCEMLKAAGVTTECFEYPNSVHGFTYQPSADTTDALQKMTAFLKKYLQ
jgi:Esterase/lipase